MKNMRWFLLFLAVVVLFTGCTEKPEPETVTTVVEGRVTYTADWEHNTITDGKYTYNFIITTAQSADTTIEKITVFYPNGASYTQERKYSGDDVGAGFSTGSADYDPERYADGDILIRIVDDRPRPEPEWKINWITVLCGAVVLGLGVLDIVKPGLWWKLRYGLYVQDAEPTEFAIFMSRIGGVICVLVGGFLVLRGLLGGTL